MDDLLQLMVTTIKITLTPISKNSPCEYHMASYPNMHICSTCPKQILLPSLITWPIWPCHVCQCTIL